MNTEIVKISSLDDSYAAKKLKEAGKIIRSGGLVVFPTETVYGLGGDATNPTAADKIYAAKGRPSDNPLIIHIAEPSDADKYTYTRDIYYRLAEKFMPGPITVVMPSRENVASTVRASLPTVAVRCPVNPIAHALIKESGVPIAAPSANLSGSPSPTCGKHVIDDMRGRVDMIIDGGHSDIGVESTIVKLEDDDSLTLLRPGAVTLEDLRTITDRVNVADAVLHALKEGEKVLSPGMKYKHYAPKSPLYLLDGTEDDRLKFLKEQKDNICVLCFDNEASELSGSVPKDHLFRLGRSGDELSEAHLLFYYLREADKLSPDAIYAPLPSLSGIGMALYNRMIRASAFKIVKV
ncbi:MAG: L-threonylcarbamoyladenylate synthase [Eubacteriales bacterium]|nr:L-threonylcarbamoyladenylate synthase [Eubacteriales bacterium]